MPTHPKTETLPACERSPASFRVRDAQIMGKPFEPLAGHAREGLFISQRPGPLALGLTPGGAYVPAPGGGVYVGGGAAGAP